MEQYLVRYVSTSERRSSQDHKLWIPPDRTTIQYNKSHQGRGHCPKLEKGQMGVHSVGRGGGGGGGSVEAGRILIFQLFQHH